MRTITLIPILLLLAVAAGAATLESAVAVSDVSSFSYGGEMLTSFTYDLPADVSVDDLMEAHLELRLIPDAPAGAKFVEVEAAAWEAGAPVVPVGCESYVSELATDRDGDAWIFLDVTPILRDAMSRNQSQVVIVVGRLSQGVLPGATVTTLDSDQGAWGMLRLHMK